MPFALATRWTLAVTGTAVQWRPHEMMEGMWGWGIGIVGALFWLALLVLVVVLIWRLVEGAGGFGSGRSGRSEPPLEILKRRYARGEIDREEFQRMKEELGG